MIESSASSGTIKDSFPLRNGQKVIVILADFMKTDKIYLDKIRSNLELLLFAFLK